MIVALLYQAVDTKACADLTCSLLIGLYNFYHFFLFVVMAWTFKLKSIKCILLLILYIIDVGSSIIEEEMIVLNDLMGSV